MGLGPEEPPKGRKRKMAEKIKIAKWIVKGELSGDEKDSDDIIESCCDLLDDANTTEIIGPCVFKGTDGKHYCVTVEAVISEAAEDFVNDLLEEERAIDDLVDNELQEKRLRDEASQKGHP